MMPVHEELNWDAVAADWRGAAVADARDAIPAEVRRAVRRQGMRLKLLTAGEVVISVVVSALVLSAMVRAPSALTVLWGIATAALLAWTWRFAIRNRRGVWAPYGETTDVFVALSMERCRRSLASAGFSRLLVAVESALLGPWLAWSVRHDAAWHDAEERMQLILAWGITALYLAGVLVWSEWYRRRKLRELEGLRQIRARLEADAS